ncbi:hypothetical protein FRB99_002843 [Tulasnella sp. 403]|nr:hypothetical protein FRB99_002843 [Tulasnella sp. 403]
MPPSTTYPPVLNKSSKDSTDLSASNEPSQEMPNPNHVSVVNVQPSSMPTMTVAEAKLAKARGPSRIRGGCFGVYSRKAGLKYVVPA